METRNYPVNFGFAWFESFFINIRIPEGYKAISFPKNKVLSLPNNGGTIMLTTKSNTTSLKLLLRFNFSKSIYSNNEYDYLKEFFNQIINIQNSYVKLVKIKA